MATVKLYNKTGDAKAQKIQENLEKNFGFLPEVFQAMGRNGDFLRVIDAFSRIVRLGEGLGRAGRISEEAIERTDGRQTGKGYSTTGIKAQFVINRLNETLGIGGWRTHRTIVVKELTTNSGRKAYEAVCDLVLELGEWTDGTFVPFAEALADGGHISMSEADARKGAFSNGLKKAAAAFGAGWQAYAGTIDDDNVPADTSMQPEQAPQVPVQKQRPTVAQVPVNPQQPVAVPRNRRP